jgi:LmbE family N-acetylglucosaminyl deacetylase
LFFTAGRILALALLLVAPAFSRAGVPEGIEPLITHATRLIVFSPHPDDESLGAGGLIRRVLAVGGKVKVVFMTDGDGFPEGVEKEDHVSHPSAKDYTRYGVERRIEALKALATLGVNDHSVVFLGFPDGGLSYLRLKFRAHPIPYKSPFTGKKHPTQFEMIIPATDYCGEDLRKEIERVLIEFRPNLLAVTGPEDWHPDHSASYYFVKEALSHLVRKHSDLRPSVLTFIIHYGQWPLDQEAGTGLRLNPPAGLGDGPQRWISFSLKPEEIGTKRKAILQYHTQLLVMGRFLLSFSRSNELFRLDDSM